MSACPRRSCTNLGFTPCLSRSVAHVCLRSWKRVFSGSFARLSRALKARFRLPPEMGVPTEEGNLRLRGKMGETGDLLDYPAELDLVASTFGLLGAIHEDFLLPPILPPRSFGWHRRLL
jgi:hypothetical protein